MERQSSKHGRLRDEAMKHEVAPQMHGGHGGHVEEWREPEPAGEDQRHRYGDSASGIPDPRRGGVPEGMSPEDVSLRSELAIYLGRATYPADRDGLIRTMTEHQAPDDLVAMVAALPQGRRFDNVRQLAEALGLGLEAHRF